MQNSLLTDAQREYLETPAGEREEKYTKQQRSYHSQNIRERVRVGVLDFRILMDYLDEDERQQIFDWGGTDNSPDHQFGVRDAVAFLYLSQHEQGIPFQRILQIGVRRAWHEIGGPELSVVVDFDVEIHEPEWHDPVELAERARDEGIESLSEDEAATLMDYAGVEGLLDDVLEGLIDSQKNRQGGFGE